MERITIKILRPCMNSISLKNYRAGDVVTISDEELKYLPREFFDVIEKAETRTKRVTEPARKRTTRAKK